MMRSRGLIPTGSTTLAVVLASLFAAANCARFLVDSSVATVPGTTPPLPYDIAIKEKNVLLQFMMHFNNHTAFTNPVGVVNGIEQQAGAPWAESANGVQPNLYFPCIQSWAWIKCLDYRVIAIDLDNPTLASYNISWGKGGQGEGPIQGTIPFDILSQLEQFQELVLSSNSITGDLKGISLLPHMVNFQVDFNKITGVIPEEIGACTGMKWLRLDANQLSGSIPSTLSLLTVMSRLSVPDNSLADSFPDYFSKLNHLKFLDLSGNAIKGHLPGNWSTLTRLTALVLSKTFINGSVPDSWANMTELVGLSLDQTQLSGPFPTAVTKMPSLFNLHLANNKLYGPVPESVWGRTLEILDISTNYLNGTLPMPNKTVQENPNYSFLASSNCFNLSNAELQATGFTTRSHAVCSAFYLSLLPPPPPAPASPSPIVYVPNSSSSSSSSTGIIVGVVCGCVALLLLVAFLVWYFRYRGRRLSTLFTKGLRQSAREFTLPELKTATNNWQTSIGKGGYGTVYKAVLKDGTAVAVKRLDQVSKQGDVEFIREVELLSRVHHRHLVNLLGFCAERGERALIYEYMAMGSLYEHLHGDSAKEFPLSWDSRCKIAIHVALGIEYLHYGADPPLIHRDIKSANILLSDDGYSKVADFGLCKEAPVGAGQDGSEQLVPTATAVRGSFGYLDPEYVNTSILSEKSDVYSYGVVLLELITGHKSIHDWQPLAYWAEEYLADREKTPLMVDPALEGNFDLDELYALCDIARTCVQDQSANRPTIRDVAKALVENMGHGMTSFAGSQQDSASIITSSQTDASSMPSSTYTPSSVNDSTEYSYQNYSETLHWTPSGSGEVSGSKSGGLTLATGTKGDRLPVPVPKRPDAPPKEESKEDGGESGNK